MNRAVRRKNSLSWLGGICLLSATITACSGGSGGNDDATAATAPASTGSEVVANLPVAGTADDCSVAAINQWVDDSMRDTYIYYDQVPVLNLDDYTDPAELVRDLRVAPDIYSSVVNAASNELVIGNSSVTRFGFWLQEASDGRQHFATISGNSPMEMAGVLRGDELIAVNSVPLDEVFTNQLWPEFVLGEQDEELTAVFTVKTGFEAARDVTVTKTTYTESTVPVFGTYEETNNSVGYMQVTAFRGTTDVEIDNAVAFLADAGISELILDLRYNGGGFTRVARQLASQIAGQAFVGEVYSRRMNNDKYSERDLERTIEPQAVTLDLSRLIVLTTGGTASASETLANGLAPLIDVVIIGDRTVGKPFTSVSQDFCGKRINAMSTITTNGVGDSVIEGIAPTCFVKDDFLAPAESVDDALTGAAFNYIQTGSCPADVQSETVSVSARQG